MASAIVSLPPNPSFHVRDEVRSDEEYSVEFYDDFEVVEEENKTEDDDGEPKEHLDNKSMSSVSVETVEDDADDDDDDDDEYTYEEILEVVEDPKGENDLNSASTPTILPTNRANDPAGTPIRKPPPMAAPKPPPIKVPSSPVVTKVTPTAPRYGRKAAPVLMTPSMQRAKAANSAGLSELSKQLRILQAKNESQSVDINRLERQLRILADLQGISVGDLRKALEDACASEAFGELQNRVLKLKYELEAATLAKQKELNQNAAAPYIANLELRVGELEEVEENQMVEIRDLYENLRQEKARSTRFELENEKLKGALQNMIQRVQNESAQAAQAEANFKKQIQDLRQLQAKILHEQAERSARNASSAAGSKGATKGDGNLSSMVSPEMAADYARMVELLKKKEDELSQIKAKLHTNETQQAEKLKESEDRSRQAHMDMKVEADKLALMVKELEDADGQNGLRLAQYKARFTVQDERIVDMGQQLESLYTAFNLLKEEFDSEKDQRAAMLSNLQDADAEIARQTKKKEEDDQKAKNRRKLDHEFPPSGVASNVRTSTFANKSNRASGNTSPGVAVRRPRVAPDAPATPVTYRDPFSISPFTNAEESFGAYETPRTPQSTTTYSTITNDRSYGYNNDTPITYATAQAFHPTPERTPSTWDLVLDRKSRNRLDILGGSDHQVDGELICGSLIVESNSMLRKWKTKPSRIYLRGEGYQWKIGERRSFPLQFGVSKVEFHPNYPLSFMVYLDPSSPHAPVIRAAAINEYDYHRWMAALFKATTGEEYEGGGDGLDATEALRPSPLYHRKPPPPPSPSYNSSSTKRLAGSERFSHLISSPLSNRKLPTTSRKGKSVNIRPLPTASRMEESEDDDLKRVLELSKHEM